MISSEKQSPREGERCVAWGGKASLRDLLREQCADPEVGGGWEAWGTGRKGGNRSGRAGRP